MIKFRRWISLAVISQIVLSNLAINIVWADDETDNATIIDMVANQMLPSLPEEVDKISENMSDDEKIQSSIKKLLDNYNSSLNALTQSNIIEILKDKVSEDKIINKVLEMFVNPPTQEGITTEVEPKQSSEYLASLKEHESPATKEAIEQQNADIIKKIEESVNALGSDKESLQLYLVSILYRNMLILIGINEGDLTAVDTEYNRMYLALSSLPVELEMLKIPEIRTDEFKEFVVKVLSVTIPEKVKENMLAMKEPPEITALEAYTAKVSEVKNYAKIRDVLIIDEQLVPESFKDDIEAIVKNSFDQLIKVDTWMEQVINYAIQETKIVTETSGTTPATDSNANSNPDYFIEALANVKRFPDINERYFGEDAWGLLDGQYLLSKFYLAIVASSAVYTPLRSTAGEIDFQEALKGLVADQNSNNLLKLYHMVKNIKKPLYYTQAHDIAYEDLGMAGASADQTPKGKAKLARLGILKDISTNQNEAAVFFTVRGQLEVNPQTGEWNFFSPDKYTGLQTSSAEPGEILSVNEEISTSNYTHNLLEVGPQPGVFATTKMVLNNIFTNSADEIIIRSKKNEILYINTFGDIVLEDNTIVLPATANPIIYSFSHSNSTYPEPPPRNIDYQDDPSRFSLVQAMRRGFARIVRADENVPALAMPLRGKWLRTSPFGNRSSTDARVNGAHNGIDLVYENRGDKHKGIYAAADGIIERRSWSSSFGYRIIIKHNDNVKTLYAHMEGFTDDDGNEITLKEGDRVTAGTRLGRMGTTGQSTGVHLHFEIHLNGRKVDPAKYIKELASSSGLAAGALVVTADPIPTEANVITAAQTRRQSLVAREGAYNPYTVAFMQYYPTLMADNQSVTIESRKDMSKSYLMMSRETADVDYGNLYQSVTRMTSKVELGALAEPISYKDTSLQQINPANSLNLTNMIRAVSIYPYFYSNSDGNNHEFYSFIKLAKTDKISTLPDGSLLAIEASDNVALLTERVMIDQGVYIFPYNKGVDLVDSSVDNYQIAKMIAKNMYWYFTHDETMKPTDHSNGLLRDTYMYYQVMLEGLQGTSSTSDFELALKFKGIIGMQIITPLMNILEDLAYLLYNSTSSIQGTLGFSGANTDPIIGKIIHFIIKYSFLFTIAILGFLLLYYSKQGDFISIIVRTAITSTVVFAFITGIPYIIPFTGNMIVEQMSNNFITDVLLTRMDDYENVGQDTQRNIAKSSIELYSLNESQILDISNKYMIELEQFRFGERLVLNKENGLYIQGNKLYMDLATLFNNNQIYNTTQNSYIQYESSNKETSIIDYYTPYHAIQEGLLETLNTIQRAYKIPRTSIYFEDGTAKDSYIYKNYIKSVPFLYPNDFTQAGITETERIKLEALFTNPNDIINLGTWIHDPPEEFRTTLWYQTMVINNFYTARIGIEKREELIRYMNYHIRLFMIQNKELFDNTTDENITKILSLQATFLFNNTVSEVGSWLRPHGYNLADIELGDILLAASTKSSDTYRLRTTDAIQLYTSYNRLGGALAISILVIFSTLLTFSITFMYLASFIVDPIIFIKKLIVGEPLRDLLNLVLKTIGLIILFKSGFNLLVLGASEILPTTLLLIILPLATATLAIIYLNKAISQIKERYSLAFNTNKLPSFRTPQFTKINKMFQNVNTNFKNFTYKNPNEHRYNSRSYRDEYDSYNTYNNYNNYNDYDDYNNYNYQNSNQYDDDYGAPPNPNIKGRSFKVE